MKLMKLLIMYERDILQSIQSRILFTKYDSRRLHNPHTIETFKIFVYDSLTISAESCGSAMQAWLTCVKVIEGLSSKGLRFQGYHLMNKHCYIYDRNIHTGETCITNEGKYTGFSIYRRPFGSSFSSRMYK